MRRPVPPSPTADSRSAAGGAAESSPIPAPSTTYRGVRRRSWGKWVAEIRQPRTRSRLWLGSYLSQEAAARAFDAAAFLLRRHSARLNLPHLLPPYLSHLPSLSPKSIQKMAIATGSMADTPPSPPVRFSDHTSSISTSNELQTELSHPWNSDSLPPHHLSPSTEQSSSSVSDSVAEDRRSRSSPPAAASDSPYSGNRGDEGVGKPNRSPNNYTIAFGNDSVAKSHEMDERIGGVHVPVLVSAKTDKNTERPSNGLMMYGVKANVNGGQHKPTEAPAVLTRSTMETGRRSLSEECAPERTHRGYDDKDAPDCHSKVDVEMDLRRGHVKGPDNIVSLPVSKRVKLVYPTTSTANLEAAGMGSIRVEESIPMQKSSPNDDEPIIGGSWDQKRDLTMSTNLQRDRESGGGIGRASVPGRASELKRGRRNIGAMAIETGKGWVADDGEVYGEGWKGRKEILMEDVSPKPTMEQIVRAMLLESLPVPAVEQAQPELTTMPIDVDDQYVGTEEDEEENHHHHDSVSLLWHYHH